MPVFVCILISLHRSGCVLIYCVGKNIHKWNVDQICCVYFYGTRSITSTYILFIIILFSTNNLSFLQLLINTIF